MYTQKTGFEEVLLGLGKEAELPESDDK